VLRGGAPAGAWADDAEAFTGRLGEVLPGLTLSPGILAPDGSAVAEVLRA